MKGVGGLRAKFLEVKANEFSNEGERKVTILETLKSLNTNDDYEWFDLTDSRDSVVGKVSINVKFDEKVMTCFSKQSPESRQRIEVDEKEFALEALKDASVRISKLARLRTELEVMHQSILNFERFWESVAWLVGSIVICLRFDSEYLPFYIGSMFIGMMLYNLRERVRQVRALAISDIPDHRSLVPYTIFLTRRFARRFVEQQSCICFTIRRVAESTGALGSSG
jgi:hypothetical protein